MGGRDGRVTEGNPGMVQGGWAYRKLDRKMR